MAVETPRRRHVHFSLEGESGKFLAYGPPDLFAEFLALVHAHCPPDLTQPDGEAPRAESEPATAEGG